MNKLNLHRTILSAALLVAAVSASSSLALAQPTGKAAQFFAQSPSGSAHLSVGRGSAMSMAKCDCSKMAMSDAAKRACMGMMRDGHSFKPTAAS